MVKCLETRGRNLQRRLTWNGHEKNQASSVPSKSNIKILSGMREKLSISKASDSSYEMRTENLGLMLVQPVQGE